MSKVKVTLIILLGAVLIVALTWGMFKATNDLTRIIGMGIGNMYTPAE